MNPGPLSHEPTRLTSRNHHGPKYSYVGRTETGSQGRSSALTHEVGHYLALNHTWGAGNTPEAATNCNQDDGVTDTPNCAGTPNCNLNINTCGAGTPGDLKDNVQNFMDYAYCYANNWIPIIMPTVMPTIGFVLLFLFLCLS